MKVFFREVLITLILALVIFFGLRITIDNRVIPSGSMEPALQIGQRLIINKLAYISHEPERGDIITFHHPQQPKDAIPFIKRVIGLPGESVEIRDGTVYIHQNGKAFALDEPYIKEPPRHDFQGDIIPENEYFVLGDNRNNSGDSRTGWTVPRQNIIGKAWLSIWPPDEWGLIVNYPFPEQLTGVTGE